MNTATTITNAASTNEGRSKNSDNNRRIPARKLALLKSRMDGAERRMNSLELELVECRSIMRRKYVVQKGEEGAPSTQIHLNPAQIEGYRLKRTILEGRLAEVSGVYLVVQRDYREAVQHNIKLGREENKQIRMQNRVVREAKKLLSRTTELLKKHGSNGGAKEIAALKAVAVKGDIREFREKFSETVERFDREHYATISGVNHVKTEIIHAVMVDLAKENGSGMITGLDDATSGQ